MPEPSAIVPKVRNLASFDGGGIRGLIQLIILDNIMETIKTEHSLQVTPYPYQYFDLIGGTSTGGLNALLLGRLRMSTKEALELYPDFAQAVFGTPKRRLRLPIQGGMFTRYSAAAMENEIKKIVRNKLKEEGAADSPMVDSREDACKTFVLATTAKNASASSGPRCIATYPPRVGTFFQPTIWEAARATSAAPMFFKSITIGQAGMTQEFIDGGLGANNPIEQVLDQAYEQFDPSDRISCILSIGTGKLKPAKYKPGYIPTSLVDTLIKISTNCEQIEQKAARQFESISNVYFRFNVEQGLQDVALDDWNRLGEVVTLTESYLREVDNLKKLKAVANALHMPQGCMTISQLRPCVNTNGEQSLFSTIPEPVQPKYFYGREDYVQLMIQTIRIKSGTSAGAHLIVRGPGGIGKTTVASVVYHHDVVKDIFKGRRHFVRCEVCDTSSSLFIAIASSLRVDISKGDPLALILDALKVISNPLLLVLDNFETSWHSGPTDQKQISIILQHISDIRHLTLILTMRGIEKPYGVRWDKLDELGRLNPDAARATFLSIADECPHTLALDDLLRDIDYVPLAVTILARVSQTGNESVDKLRDRWRSQSTKLLNIRGTSDREGSIEISIELSLHSRLMKECPDALRLLSIICELPAGISAKTSDICAQTTITEVSADDAVHTLKRLSLAYQSSPSHLTTLSPIRAYIKCHHRPHNSDLDVLHQWHQHLAERGNCNPGDKQFLEIVQDCRLNRENIFYILQSVIDSRHEGEDIIRAVQGFSRFSYWTVPNSDILCYLLEAAKKKMFTVPTHIGPELLRTLGEIMCMQSDYDVARSALEEARAEFQSIGHHQRAAQCLGSLGDIMRMQSNYDGGRSTLEKARAEFQSVGDRVGAAQCLQSLGNIMRMQDDYDGGQFALEEARTEFQSVGDRLGAAECLQSLGDIMRMQSDYDVAQSALEEAKAEFQSIGDHQGAAQCLWSLGDIMHMQDDYDGGQSALEEAKAEFQSVGNRLGAAQCLRSLGNIMHMQSDYDGGQSALEEARAEFQSVGNRVGAAQCLWSLGNIMCMQDDYDGGRSALEEARVEFQSVGNRLGAAQCLQSIMHMQDDYDGGQSALEEAREEFQSIGDRVGACNEAAVRRLCEREVPPCDSRQEALSPYALAGPYDPLAESRWLGAQPASASVCGTRRSQ